MTGHQDHGGPAAEGPPPRPAFLPPAMPPPPDVQEAELPPQSRPKASAWTIAALLTAVVLLVSAFLPWLEAVSRFAGFAELFDQEIATAGVDVDGTGQVLPVLAVVAIVMLVWGLVSGDQRIAALAAIPAALSLLCCVIFVIRLDTVRDQFALGRFGGLDLTAGYGWYLAVTASILLIGLSLARIRRG